MANKPVTDGGVAMYSVRTLDAEGCDELCAVDERQALQTDLTVDTHDPKMVLIWFCWCVAISSVGGDAAYV